MDFITVLLIAVGLSMDSLSVSLANGIVMRKFIVRQCLKIALVFAIFQAGMTFAGWGLGYYFSGLINFIDHWIAFVLLSYLGGKMIYESLRKGDNEEHENVKLLSFKTICTLAIATSIDALAVGVGMAFLNSGIIMPVSIIFITTFLFSYFGLFFGYKSGKIKYINVELVGGLILIGIGSKVLIEHLCFH